MRLRRDVEVEFIRDGQMLGIRMVIDVKGTTMTLSLGQGITEQEAHLFEQAFRETYEIGFNTGDDKNNLWRIWSNEHKGWWRIGEKGYTQNLKEAGIYEYKKALEVVEGANKFLNADEEPHEAMILYNG